MHGSIVHLLGSSGVHHKSSSDGIKWVGQDSSRDSDDLGKHPHGEDVGVLGVWEEHWFSSIEHTEVSSTVCNDSNDGDSESSVKSLWSILGQDLGEAVNETSEFSLSSRSDISSKTGSGEVKWVDNTERGGSSSSTRHAVSNEEHTWVGLLVVWVEDGLVEVLEGEVQGLGWEVTNNISQVSSPEG